MSTKKDIRMHWKIYYIWGINMEATNLNNPEILPVNGHDICNYLARYGLGNYLIQAVLKFDGRLDFDKLSEAVMLSVEEEPVLGCRFVEGDPPYWRRMNNLDAAMFSSLEITDDPDKAVKRFLERPLSMDKDPMVKIRLIRSDDYDTLCIKLNHACCDGAGSKEYIGLLSEIYSSIIRENGIYIPIPKIAGRTDQDRLFDQLCIENPVKEWKPSKLSPRTAWPFPWKPWRRDSIRFSVCRLPSGQLDVMSEYGKSRGATINDLILTAFYRAMFKISKPPYGVPMDIGSTIDMRRYLPDRKAQAIRNFSGGFVTRIARKKGEPFERTLHRVVKATTKIKAGNPGLQNAIGAERVERKSFSKLSARFRKVSFASRIASIIPFFINSAGAGISNFGLVSNSLIRFGDATATDAYILPPVVRAPGFLLLACTYNGILTLVLGYYKASICRKDVERLLRKIRDELVEGCR